jgi:hypothetical protein
MALQIGRFARHARGCVAAASKFVHASPAHLAPPESAAAAAASGCCALVGSLPCLGQRQRTLAWGCPACPALRCAAGGRTHHRCLMPARRSLPCTTGSCTTGPRWPSGRRPRPGASRRPGPLQQPPRRATSWPCITLVGRLSSPRRRSVQARCCMHAPLWPRRPHPPGPRSQARWMTAPCLTPRAARTVGRWSSRSAAAR